MSKKHGRKTSLKYRSITIDHENVDKKIKKKHFQLLILLFIGIMALSGGTYAFLATTKTGEEEAEIIAGTLKVNYADKNRINLDNTYPMSDSQGLNTEPYQFTITNEGSVQGRYEISLEELAGNTLDKSNIRYSIKEGNGSWSTAKSLEDGLVLKSDGILDGESSITYQLKMWLKENAKNEVQGLTYKARIVVDLVQENATNITTTNPVVRLNGEKEVKVVQGSTYTESGVKDIISKDNLNVSNVSKRYEYYNGTTTVAVSGVDTTKVGIYYIYYEITDSQGLKGIATRVVNVTRKDATPPVITLSGENPKVLDYNTEYVEPGYTSVDDQDGTITNKVIIVGTVNKEIPGTYTIKYISIDTLGNISSKTREVIVEKPAKEVTMGSLRVDNWILTSRIDVSLDSKADKAYYAVKETEQKPSDNEYEEMTEKTAGANGYYTYTASKTIYENGTYYVYTKDLNGEIKEKVIVIDNIDTTKPTCTFSNIEYVGLDKTAKAELTCTDIVDTKNATVTKDILDVSDDTLVSIESITTKERIGEDAPRGDQKGYKYEITLKGKKTGVFTLGLKQGKIEDTVGRKNDRLEKTNIKVTQITPDTDKITLDLAGTDTHQIVITKSYAGNLSYVSSDTDIAEVSSTGLITAKKIGSATITVTESNGGATTTVDVTVERTLTQTFYYNSNPNNGGTTITATQTTCIKKQHTGTCVSDVPSAVRNSVGTYNNAYVGLSTSTGNMTQDVAASAETVTISTDTTYYAIYRTPVDIYRPNTEGTGANSVTKDIYYRNQWFTATNAIHDPVLTTSATGLSNVEPTIVTGYSFSTLCTAVNSGGTCASVADKAKTDTTTFYVTETKGMTSTFYYSNSATGGKTSVTANGTRTLDCASTTQARITNGGITPTLSETTPYGTTQIGWATSSDTMSTTTTTTANANYYRVYQKSVDIYRPNTEGTGANSVEKQQYYRNSYYGSGSNYTTILTTSTTGLSNVEPTMVTGYSFSTLCTAVNSGGTCASVADKAKTNTTTFYVAETKSVEATFNYWSGSAAASAKASGTRTLDCASTTQARITNGNIAVPSAASTNRAKDSITYTYRGVSTSNAANATVATPTTANQTYYSSYSATMTGTFNYWSGTAAASKTATATRYMNYAGTYSYTNYTIPDDAKANRAKSGTSFTYRGVSTSDSGSATTATPTSQYTTFYSSYSRIVTATKYVYNNSSSTATGTAYMNYAGTTTNASIGLGTTGKQTVSNVEYSPRHWSTSNAADASSSVALNGNASIWQDTTYYMSYSATMTATFNYWSGTAAASTTANATRYMGYTGSYAYTNYTIPDAAKANRTKDSLTYTYRGVSTANGATSTVATPTTENTVFYTSYYLDRTATYYYSNTEAGGRTSTTSAAARRYMNYQGTYSESNYTTPTLTGHQTPYGTTHQGWSTSLSNMTTTTPNTSVTAVYAVYRANVTLYYYSSSYTNTTIYRNSYLSSTSSNFTTVLSTSTTGTSNYTTAVGPGSAVWVGLSTGQDTTAEYTSVAGAATSKSTTLYTVYSFTASFTKGSNVSDIGSTSQTCKITSTSTSCTITAPSISPNTGYTSNGWSKAATPACTSCTASAAGSGTITLYGAAAYTCSASDVTKPVITSATASTTLDISNYVNFNATDAGTKIVGYNINTSTTAPTTWIPVVNAVEEATETKYELSAAWARVFHHNNHWGNVYFSNATEAKSANTVDKYSVLGNIANYKNSSNWEFLLQYPVVSSTGYNRWTQTSNPLTTTNSVTGYTAVGTPSWTGDNWGGLALSTNSTNTLMDGQITSNAYWWFAIGVYSAYQGSMPGPNDTLTSTANLWSRIDNLSTTTSANLTRRLGDLKSNTKYYVWVKDAAGNTAYKDVTTSYVDTTAPTASITSTNNVAESQTVTLTMGDNKALDKYYFGTSNPANTNVTYTAISNSPTSSAPTTTVSDGGTYYLSVLDKAGNRTIVSKTFYKTSLTPNRSSVSPTSVVTMSGNSFTIPTPSAATGYTFNGWYKESGLTNSAGTTWTPTASATLYGKWTANTYAITYDYNTTNYTFASNNYIDTKYTIDWDRNFKLNSTINFPTLSQRYLLFGNYNSTNELNLELSSNKLRAWSGNDKSLSSATVAANTDIAIEFNYTASNKAYTFTSTGTNSNATAPGTNDKTGAGAQSLRIGTDNRTDGTFKPYTLKAAKITDYYVYATKLTRLPSSPTKPGYAFNGWYTAASGGSQVTASTDVPAGNTTYYAHWTANELTFANQSITKTFSTSSQTASVTVASNGTGVYTYSEVSEKNSSGTATSYISVSGTTITLAANTPTGTYTYVIRATDSNSGKTKDATYTITVNGITREATFNPNSNTLSTPSGCNKNSSTGVVTCKCTTTGTNTSCNVTTPTITANTNTPTICGFTTSSTGASSGCTGHNTSISLSNNPTYYAQTYKSAITHTITFYKNGASTQTNASGTAVTDNTVTRTCTRPATYNGSAQAGKCSITSPTIVAATNFSVVGYGTSSGATTSTWNHNTSKTDVSANANYYAVTKRQLSVTFSRNTTEISAIGSTTGSCYVYNGGTSCTASANSPTITANTGFVALGFFTSNTGTMTSSSSPKLAASTSYTIQTGATDLANKKIQTGATVYARARYPVASEVGYSNSSTGLKCVTSGKGCTNGAACTDTQCALDALASLLK